MKEVDYPETWLTCSKRRDVGGGVTILGMSKIIENRRNNYNLPDWFHLIPMIRLQKDHQ